MHIALAAVYLDLSAGIAFAQTQPGGKQPTNSPLSTGRSVSPETKGQMQPQGLTGPVDTTSGGAPAESPQGETPGVQAAPDGSSKTIVEPKK